VKKNKMALQARSLSPQESRVVLALSERGLKGVAREDIIKLLGASSKAVDNIMESLRRKGWLERAAGANTCLSLLSRDARGPRQ
jgi:DNA-binding MarR family transcriptional regulator